MRGELRVEQSSDELERVAMSFRLWLRRRRGADPEGRYGSQLSAIERVIETALGVLGDELAGLRAGGSPAGTVYERCRAIDTQLVFVRRVWSYYSEKWDQRDRRELSDVLAAADELVWSCYAPPLERAGDASGAAPLPYLVDDCSAFAIAGVQVPAALRPSDRLLCEALEELPVGLIGLPWICVSRPWWLVVVAHEVGHQILYAIERGAVAGRVEELVADALDDEGAAGPAEAWRAWASEIVADAFALAMVGSAHAWALTELQAGGDQWLAAESLGSYPPPLVRQALAGRILSALGLPLERAVPLVLIPRLAELDLSGDERSRVEWLLAAVPALAAGLCRIEIAAGKTLPELTGWDPLAHGQTGSGWWRDQFAAVAAPTAEGSADAARLACAGAVGRWVEIAAVADKEERAHGMESLRERVLDVLPGCGPAGERGPEEVRAGVDIDELALDLARRMRELPAEEPRSVRPPIAPRGE